MDGIERRLAGHAIAGLDSSIWIYHFEANERYALLAADILRRVQAGRPSGIISVVTLLELTVQPYRLGKPEIATHYEALLSHFPNLTIVSTNRTIARRAAELRAVYGLRTADAILIATALVSGATVWITNDRALQRLKGVIDVVLLDEFVDEIQT